MEKKHLLDDNNFYNDKCNYIVITVIILSIIRSDFKKQGNILRIFKSFFMYELCIDKLGVIR